MATVTTSKRSHERAKNINKIIDLTLDSDEERPAKRQRSESYTTPPLNDSHNQTRPTFTAGQRKHLKHASQTSSQSGEKAAAVPRQAFLRRSGTPVQNENSLSNGIPGLALRPSPQPHKHERAREGSLSHFARSRTPIDVDLDIDSHAATKSRKLQHATSTRRSSPLRQGEQVNPGNFIVPDVKPFMFDPTSTITTVTKDPTSAMLLHRKPTLGLGVTAGKPLIQVPPRAQSANKVLLGTLSRSRNQQAPTSPRKSLVKVNVPLHPLQLESKRKDMIRHLKEDVRYMEQNSDKVFQITGVAPFDNTILNEEVLKKAAQQKKRAHLDRQQVRLDLDETLATAAADPHGSEQTHRPLHPRSQARSILRARFKKDQLATLTFRNTRSSRELNGKFQFITSYILSRKAAARKKIPLVPRNCQCDTCDSNCACLTTCQKVDEGGFEYNVDVQPYQRRSDGIVVLTDEYINKWKTTVRIYECGDYCRCSSECTNRVVQRGRTLPLQIFETQKCGFGVRSSSSIVRGQFIDIYLGEVVTTAELTKREAAAEEDTPSYAMTLDVFEDDVDKMLHIDGVNFGSVTRFFNHSCDPNCTTVPVVPSNGTKHLYYVAFFAIKDIPANTELTIDYDPNLLEDDEEIVDSAVVRCQCGSANCRKRLWAPGKEKRGRKKILPSKEDD